MKKNMLTFLLFIFSVSSFAQIVVAGKVIDADFERTLAGVNVTVKGKLDKGTITDSNGRFSIRMETKVDAIELSFEGYETIKVKLGASTQNLIIFLPTEVTLMEDMSELKNLSNEGERKEKRVKKKP